MGNKPNIIIITTDQMRADAMGFINPVVITPNLDKLAKQGTVFERAYCTSPVCTPSRVAILTGRYPHCTGAWNVGVSMKDEEVTICDFLKKLEYRTAVVGKTHFRQQCKDDFTMCPQEVRIRDRVRSMDGTYFGFDEHHITEGNDVDEYFNWLKEVAPEYIQNLGKPINTKSDVWVSEMPEEYHNTHWIAQKGIEQLDKHDTSKPLFMWMSFVDPHHPFNPPKKYADMYSNVEILKGPQREGEHDLRPNHLRHQGNTSNFAKEYWPGGGEEYTKSEEELEEAIRNYYAMITFIDKEIGRVLKTLEDKGMRENTIIIFSSDHGELLGDHKLLYKGPWMYEGLTRVPMIFNGGKNIKERTTKALMENVDILPTILDLIGEDIPYGVQGKSQLKVITGEVSTVRDSAITSYDAHDRGIDIKCMRTKNHKLVVFAGENYGELYDLDADPHELNNLYFDLSYSEIKAQLFEKLCHRMILDQDPLPERKAFW